jgi:hypothetical protein
MLPLNRPQRWFGPDDFDGSGNPAFDAAQRDLLIAAWDAEKARRLSEMNIFQRAWYALFNDADTLP